MALSSHVQKSTCGRVRGGLASWMQNVGSNDPHTFQVSVVRRRANFPLLFAFHRAELSRLPSPTNFSLTPSSNGTEVHGGLLLGGFLRTCMGCGVARSVIRGRLGMAARCFALMASRGARSPSPARAAPTCGASPATASPAMSGWSARAQRSSATSNRSPDLPHSRHPAFPTSRIPDIPHSHPTSHLPGRCARFVRLLR
jgi:hypothetical protein